MLSTDSLRRFVAEVDRTLDEFDDLFPVQEARSPAIGGRDPAPGRHIGSERDPDRAHLTPECPWLPRPVQVPSRRQA